MNKVFAGLAKDGKGTMGWCHGFKLHLLCNDSGDVITFCLTGANVDDRDDRVWSVFIKHLYGKVFADRGYIKKELFESTLRARHTPRTRYQDQHEKQAHAHVGQNHAQKEVRHRVHQRTDQEQGEHCALETPIRTQLYFYYEHLCRTHRILLLR